MKRGREMTPAPRTGVGGIRGIRTPGSSPAGEVHEWSARGVSTFADPKRGPAMERPGQVLKGPPKQSNRTLTELEGNPHVSHVSQGRELR